MTLSGLKRPADDGLAEGALAAGKGSARASRADCGASPQSLFEFPPNPGTQRASLQIKFANPRRLRQHARRVRYPEARAPHPVSGSVNLFGRTRIGVRFHIAPLFVHHPAQLPLHCLERVVYHLCQRIVRAVIDLFFFSDQFVSGRDGDINPHPELVSFFVSVIWLLNSNVAPADVIAKFVQPGGFLQHQLFDSLGFFQATVSDVYWQLHSGLYSNAFGPQTPSVLMLVGLPPIS